MVSPETVRLSPGEKVLVDSIIEHVYPNPAAGSALPVERSDLRAAQGMARKVC